MDSQIVWIDDENDCSVHASVIFCSTAARERLQLIQRQSSGKKVDVDTIGLIKK